MACPGNHPARNLAACLAGVPVDLVAVSRGSCQMRSAHGLGVVCADGLALALLAEG